MIIPTKQERQLAEVVNELSAVKPTLIAIVDALACYRYELETQIAKHLTRCAEEYEHKDGSERALCVAAALRIQALEVAAGVHRGHVDGRCEYCGTKLAEYKGAGIKAVLCRLCDAEHAQELKR